MRIAAQLREQLALVRRRWLLDQAECTVLLPGESPSIRIVRFLTSTQTKRVELVARRYWIIGRYSKELTHGTILSVFAQVPGFEE